MTNQRATDYGMIDSMAIFMPYWKIVILLQIPFVLSTTCTTLMVNRVFLIQSYKVPGLVDLTQWKDERINGGKDDYRIYNFTPYFMMDAINYSCWDGLKWNPISKRSLAYLPR